jgi:hypothetical protein
MHCAGARTRRLSEAGRQMADITNELPARRSALHAIIRMQLIEPVLRA